MILSKKNNHEFSCLGWIFGRVSFRTVSTFNIFSLHLLDPSLFLWIVQFTCQGGVFSFSNDMLLPLQLFNPGFTWNVFGPQGLAGSFEDTLSGQVNVISFVLTFVYHFVNQIHCQNYYSFVA